MQSLRNTLNSVFVRNRPASRTNEMPMTAADYINGRSVYIARIAVDTQRRRLPFEQKLQEAAEALEKAVLALRVYELYLETFKAYPNDIIEQGRHYFEGLCILREEFLRGTAEILKERDAYIKKGRVCILSPESRTMLLEEKREVVISILRQATVLMSHEMSSTAKEALQLKIDRLKERIEGLFAEKIVLNDAVEEERHHFERAVSQYVQAFGSNSILVICGTFDTVMRREEMLSHIKSLFAHLDSDGKRQLLSLRTPSDNRTELPGYTALHLCCHYGHTEIGQFLIDQGADIRLTTMSNQTVLHELGVSDDASLMLYILKHPDGVKLDVNARSDYGRTPLHYAAFHGSLQVATILLEMKARVDVATDTTLLTPLHNAVLRSPVSLVKLLLENGADRNAQDSAGQTPITLVGVNDSSRGLPVRQQVFDLLSGADEF